MASGAATFTVTDARARRYVVKDDIAAIAGRLASDARANTPVQSGRMAAGWRTVPGRDPGTTLVVNDVPYAVYVEHGTKNMLPRAPLGRALAAARSR
jgi:hypothetical protein